MSELRTSIAYPRRKSGVGLHVVICCDMLCNVVFCCVRLYLLAACVCVGLGVALCRAPSLYVALRRLFLGASLLRVVCSTVLVFVYRWV